MMPFEFLGAPGSPYTRKMLAYLRYRRLPYRITWGSHLDPTDRPQPKVKLLPTFYFVGADGAAQALVDSTPLIRRIEAMSQDRSGLPSDPALRLLDDLLEDYGDEWLTKAMFHYRWHYQADIERAGDILPRWRVKAPPNAVATKAKTMIAERQISRLYVVGSNPTTARVIEASYERFVQRFAAHLDRHPFLLGDRPGAGDFAVYGQLTQLTHFDPTPMAYCLAHAPRVYAWVDVVEDLSGLEPADQDWLDPAAIPDSLRAIFEEVGRCYVPVMLANAQALAKGVSKVETEVEGLPWVQEPFPYQGRCLTWLREAYGALPVDARAKVDAALAGTGCERLFQV